MYTFATKLANTGAILHLLVSNRNLQLSATNCGTTWHCVLHSVFSTIKLQLLCPSLECIVVKILNAASKKITTSFF